MCMVLCKLFVSLVFLEFLFFVGKWCYNWVSKAIINKEGKNGVGEGSHIKACCEGNISEIV